MHASSFPPQRIPVVPVCAPWSRFPVEAPSFLAPSHPSLCYRRPFPRACSIFPSPSEPQSSLPPLAAVVPFPVHACFIVPPPLASPRARSMVPFSCRGSIVPCTVASLVHVSLPLSISPSPDDAAPSPPAQVSYRPHKPRQCCIVPTNPVNAASFLTLSPPHRSSIAPTHPRQCSFLRRRPLPPRPLPPSPIEAPSFVIPSLPSLGYRRRFPRACVPSPVKRSFRR